jgi:hypothetical protein
MMRASLFKNDDKLRYNEQLEPAEDYDLWVTLSMKGKMANLPDALLDYRWHDNQTSKIRASQQQQSGLLIQRKYIELLTGKTTVADSFLVSDFSSLPSIYKYKKAEKILIRSLRNNFGIDAKNYLSKRWKNALRNSAKHLPRPFGTVFLRAMRFVENNTR